MPLVVISRSTANRLASADCDTTALCVTRAVSLAVRCADKAISVVRDTRTSYDSAGSAPERAAIRRPNITRK